MCSLVAARLHWCVDSCVAVRAGAQLVAGRCAAWIARRPCQRAQPLSPHGSLARPPTRVGWERSANCCCRHQWRRSRTTGSALRPPGSTSTTFTTHTTTATTVRAHTFEHACVMCRVSRVACHVSCVVSCVRTHACVVSCVRAHATRQRNDSRVGCRPCCTSIPYQEMTRVLGAALASPASRIPHPAAAVAAQETRWCRSTGSLAPLLKNLRHQRVGPLQLVPRLRPSEVSRQTHLLVRKVHANIITLNSSLAEEIYMNLVHVCKEAVHVA